MTVILTRKLAEIVDGVDLHAYTCGDLIDLPSSDARLLIAEEWAIEDRRLAAYAHEGERRDHGRITTGTINRVRIP